ncbi:hypothetical protein MMC22_001892 [Lobaria immixta]|nr:hypothetical protein [Lobaria immixta]
MAEAVVAIALASSILAMIEFAGKVVKRLDEFKTNVNDLPQSFLHISAQLPLLVDIANRLHAQACQDELNNTTKRALVPVVKGLTGEIQNLDAVLRKVLPAARASTWEKGVKAVKSFAAQKSVDEFAAIIRDYVTNLTAFQATHNADLIRSLVSSIKDHSSIPPALEPIKTRKPVWMISYDSDDHFVGRDAVIEAIRRQFGDGKCRVALTGIGGVGCVLTTGPLRIVEHRSNALVHRKSRIAIQYCYQHRQQISGSDVFWVHGASKARFEAAYRQIARTLDVPGRQDPEVDHLQLVSDWLSSEENGSWLMVLDNADDRDLWLGPSQRNRSCEKRSRPLIDYLPRGHHGRILITSRDSQLGYTLVEGKHDPIKVTRLEPLEARSLLLSKIEDGNELSNEDADELTDALEYLPLTITQAAAYLKEIGEPVSDYLQLIRAGRSDIPEILEESVHDPGRDREASNSVFQTWRISFDQILRQSPRAADALSLMVMFDRQAISQELLQNSEERPLEFKAAMSKLKAFALITEEKISSTYSLHRLVQISTQRWLEHQDRLSNWQEAAVSAVARQCPSNVNYNVWPLLNDLNSHARVVLGYKISARSGQINRANILHSLGHYNLEQGQDLSALDLLLESRTLRREHLGLEHEDTLTSMGLLGVAYNKLSNFKEAEEILLQVLETANQVPTLNHRIKFKCISRLAIVYSRRGQSTQSQKLQLEVLDLMKRELGPENPDTLTEMTNLAYTYHKLKEWKKAEDLELEALRLRRQILGESHPDTLTVMANLALTYAAQQRWQEAAQLNQETLDQRMKTLGPDHPRTLRTMQDLARSNIRQGRWFEAKVLAEAVLEKLQQRHEDTHSEIMRATKQLREIEMAEARHGSAGSSRARTQAQGYQNRTPRYRRTKTREYGHEGGMGQQQRSQVPDAPSRPREQLTEYDNHFPMLSSPSTNRG